jgi:hypothetical protein
MVKNRHIRSCDWTAEHIDGANGTCKLQQVNQCRNAACRPDVAWDNGNTRSGRFRLECSTNLRLLTPFEWQVFAYVNCRRCASCLPGLLRT